MNFNNAVVIGTVAVAAVSMLIGGIYYSKGKSKPEVDLTQDKEEVVKRYADLDVEKEDDLRDLWADIEFDLNKKFKDQPIAKEEMLNFNDDHYNNLLKEFKKC